MHFFERVIKDMIFPHFTWNGIFSCGGDKRVFADRVLKCGFCKFTFMLIALIGLIPFLSIHFNIIHSSSAMRLLLFSEDS